MVECSPDGVAVIMTETMAMTPSADAVGRILQPVISRIRSLSAFRDLLHLVHLRSAQKKPYCYIPSNPTNTFLLKTSFNERFVNIVMKKVCKLGQQIHRYVEWI